MKTFAALVAFLAPAAVMAQTPTTPAGAASTCDAEYIVEDCLSSTQARQAECAYNDYSCQCSAYEAIATCYNNCPNDNRAPIAQGQVDQFCALATQYASTNTPAATGSAASTAPTRSAASPTASGSDSESSSTATSSGSTSSSTSESSSANSAADLAISAGSLLAAVAGVMGALL